MRRLRRVGVTALTAVSVIGVAALPASSATARPIAWGPCPAIHSAQGAVCATVSVPRDYADPHGPTISLTVSKMPARDPAHRRGALFGNPGGPGLDAVGMFTMRLPKAVRDEWDLIAVQPRGLISSTPLKCTSIDDVGLSSIVDYGARFRAGCERFAPGYPRTITTENTARDTDRVRAALGYATVSLYGASYGALLMATYASLFPGRVDRLILDSAVDPNLIWNGALQVQAPHYRDRLVDMMTWIAANDHRYHLGTTALQVYRRWSARVTAEAGVPPSVGPPPAVISDVPPGLRIVARQYLAGTNLTGPARVRFENFVRSVATGRSQDQSALLLLTRLAVPSRNIWPTVAARTAGTLIGPRSLPPSVATRLANATDLQSVLMCNENRVPAQPLDLPAVIYTMLVSRDAFDGPGLAFSSGVACAGAAPVVRPITVGNNGLRWAPMQLQSLGDPQTPYRQSLVMARVMRSQLVTVGGGDHVQLGRMNPVVDAAVVAYLRSGRVPVSAAPQAPIVLNLDGSQWNSYVGRGQ